MSLRTPRLMMAVLATLSAAAFAAVPRREGDLPVAVSGPPPPPPPPLEDSLYLFAASAEDRYVPPLEFELEKIPRADSLRPSRGFQNRKSTSTLGRVRIRGPP